MPRQFAAIVPLFTLLVALTGCSQVEQAPIASDLDREAEIQKITPDALAARIEGGDPPFVLDVRTPEEFAQGHIPGAINIPHDQLEERLAELSIEPTDEVVVHCQGGRRASQCEALLRETGFTKVLDLEGHFGEWQKQGLPEESPAPTAEPAPTTE